MADTKRATDASNETSTTSLDGKARTWLDKMLPLLEGRPTPGTGSPARNKPGDLGFHAHQYPQSVPTAAPRTMVDQLTAAIKAKDAHKVSQYVSLLIVSGHHLSGPDSKGDYPLILAVQTGDHIITSLVVQSNTNIRNAAGETPLIIAAQLGNLKIVEMLIKNVADVTYQDKKSKTALDYAIEKQQADPANKELARIVKCLQREMQLLKELEERSKVPPESPSVEPKPKKP